MSAESSLTETLTSSEKDALRIYLVSSDVKDLARRIGRSDHEAERRLKSARRKLGVRRSLDAAHMLARAEGEHAYGTPVSAQKDVPAAAGFTLHAPAFEGGRFDWLLPPRGRPWNDRPWQARLSTMLLWLMLLLVCGVIAVALSVGLSSLLDASR